MEVISQNIANANTTKTDEGGPYRRQMVHFDMMLHNPLCHLLAVLAPMAMATSHQ